MNRITFAVKSALGLAMLAPSALALAQATTPPASQELEEVIVTGIRWADELSIDAKREAVSVVDVVSAEDIGKMPDKNIADSLKRVPGVTISSAGASEGGFDENDRVSLRGTNPSLTQTLIDGHNVAAGDWFVLNQTGTVGRSVSYTLLPSEVVSQVVVHKSSEAALVEGGVAGTVNIVTRKALDAKDPLTFQASIGTVYADQPDDYDPQANALFNWQNDGRTFGVLLQGFYEQRHLRRDGVELLGYDTILPTSAIAASNPDLAGVQYPTMIGAALFEQKRTRSGGLLDMQWKPSDDVNLNLTGFYSNVDAPNYNRNYLVWNTHYINFGAGQPPDAGYVVKHNTLTQANFTGVPGTFYGVYDQISRPNESESTYFANLDGSWHATERLTFDGQLGYSEGDGKTPTQNVSETLPGAGAGAAWQLHGTNNGPDFNLHATDNTTPFPGDTPVDFGWIFGAQDVEVKDKEEWIKLDGTFGMGDGTWSDVKFGARHESHDRDSLGALAQGPTGAGQSTGNYPTTWHNYPSDFESFGGSIPQGVWYWTPNQLADYNAPGNVQRDPILRAYAQYWFKLNEKTDAAYVQADFRGSRWSGNIGVRYVRTEDNITTYQQDSTVTPSTPGAVTTSLFGPYVGNHTSHTYDDVLPSANLKFDLTDDLVLRFAASETMTRADYSALAGATNLGAPPSEGGIGSGTTGNPDLKPVKSTNLDAGIEWYFAKRSLLGATLFYMDLNNYISYGTRPISVLSFSSEFPDGQVLDYLVTTPINANGRVDGVELTYQQALGEHFGLQLNYTYADGKQTSDVVNGDDRLVGLSENTYNASGYYEDEHFSARVSYNYRSAFYSGLDRSSAFSQGELGTLAASLAYAFNDQFSVTLDGQNLNNPTLKYYALNTDQPRAMYVNGRQIYLNLRAKF